LRKVPQVKWKNPGKNKLGRQGKRKPKKKMGEKGINPNNHRKKKE